MRAPDELKSILAAMLDERGTGPLMVHSDLLRAGIPKGAKPGKQGLLRSHWDNLKMIAGDRQIWMPVFNYSFPSIRSFDVKETKSVIGPFTEFFRTDLADWRSTTPMISFAGTGEAPPEDIGPEIDPFGPLSVYNHLAQSDGVYFAYGASIETASPIHVAERYSGGPTYRYDKYFPGEVILTDGSKRKVVLRYHVRPWGSGLDYDYPRLQSDLSNAGLCQILERGSMRFMIATAGQIIQYWTHRLSEDPLYLLNQVSRRWVEPMLEQLGRPFQLDDFERPGETTQ